MTSQQTPTSKAIKELRLPISRVKTIMKSSPQVEAIGQDCLFLVAKATELFVHYLSEEAYQKSPTKTNSLEYKHLAEVVQTNDTLEFLREIMPRKITVRQFKEMMAGMNSSSDSDSDSQSDDSDSNSDSDDKAENGNSSDSSHDKKNGNEDSSDKSSESDSDEEMKN